MFNLEVAQGVFPYVQKSILTNLILVGLNKSILYYTILYFTPNFYFRCLKIWYLESELKSKYCV